MEADTQKIKYVESNQRSTTEHENGKVQFSGSYKVYLQGILNDVNVKDTSFLDCKHKHVMKCGAPPDKFGVLYRMFN